MFAAVEVAAVLYGVEKIVSANTSAKGIYSIFDSITSFNGSSSIQIKNTVARLNIESDINVFKILIKEIDPKNIEKSTTLSLCIKCLIDDINKIDNILILINEKLCYNKSLYIKTPFRKYKFDDDLELLCITKEKFDRQAKTLLSLLNIKDSLTQYIKPQLHDIDVSIIQ
jgi:hypothetical protein